MCANMRAYYPFEHTDTHIIRKYAHSCAHTLYAWKPLYDITAEEFKPWAILILFMEINKYIMMYLNMYLLLQKECTCSIRS